MVRSTKRSRAVSGTIGIRSYLPNKRRRPNRRRAPRRSQRVRRRLSATRRGACSAAVQNRQLAKSMWRALAPEKKVITGAIGTSVVTMDTPRFFPVYGGSLFQDIGLGDTNTSRDGAFVNIKYHHHYIAFQRDPDSGLGNYPHPLQCRLIIIRNSDFSAPRVAPYATAGVYTAGDLLNTVTSQIGFGGDDYNALRVQSPRREVFAQTGTQGRNKIVADIKFQLSSVDTDTSASRFGQEKRFTFKWPARKMCYSSSNVPQETYSYWICCHLPNGSHSSIEPTLHINGRMVTAFTDP